MHDISWSAEEYAEKKIEKKNTKRTTKKKKKSLFIIRTITIYENETRRGNKLLLLLY